MIRSLSAGFGYFLVVFTLGAILGFVREVLVAPLTGSVIAVLMEMPVMIGAAWFVCRLMIHKFNISDDVNQRLAMGAFAFCLLMVGELLLSMILQGSDITGFLRMYELPENRIGLGGQIAFALFPVIQRYGTALHER
ncbi:hypothetical protein A8B75_10030 [Sphingomonadales bacterium EhC05]|jgi:hypothetical protein|uniref:hypothetical protein n=1 Tax=Parasphingorhabdus sp. TaxID=2709688 RepID=UPI0007F4AE0D|nr:hypothetical protein A8B75_10030 [Sphingomonadales bacterium EhC05]